MWRERALVRAGKINMQQWALRWSAHTARTTGVCVMPAIGDVVQTGCMMVFRGMLGWVPKGSWKMQDGEMGAELKEFEWGQFVPAQ